MTWKGVCGVGCPSCFSEEFRPAGKRADGAKISVCERCGLGFLNPMPTSEEIEKMYLNYFQRTGGVGYSRYPTWLHTTPLDYLLLDSIRRYSHATPTTCLDVGCAYGARVAFFQKRGFRATGVDISEEATSYGRMRWKLDLRTMRFDEFVSQESYDVITMIDFIEHLPESSLWSAELDSLTHRGSVILILTPDFDCYSLYGDKWIGYNTSFEHVLFYNRISLNRILDQSGFKVVFASNIKLRSPTADVAAAIPVKPRSRLVESLRKQEWFETARNIDIFRQSVMHKLSWSKILSTDNLGSSLFVVARRAGQPRLRL